MQFNSQKIFFCILVGLISVGGCATATLSSRSLAKNATVTTKSSEHFFLVLLKEHSDQVWADSIHPIVKKTIFDFQASKELPNGLIYGNSVRKLNLNGMCPSEIDQHLKSIKCKLEMDVLKNSRTQKPILLANGKTIPMHLYLCPDGGVVRLKLQGDPSSRFRPQPHASKSLRYPYNASFMTFDDERVKVDNQGYAVPKWAKDLNTKQVAEDQKQNFIEDWANDAHTDLPQGCG